MTNTIKRGAVVTVQGLKDGEGRLRRFQVRRIGATGRTLTIYEICADEFRRACPMVVMAEQCAVVA